MLDGNHEKLFTGQLPSRLVIGCVDNDAFNGNYVKNPINFKHYALSEISLHLDGNSEPVKPLLPNFAKRQYIQAYMSLFSGTGKENRDEGNDIAREDTPRATPCTHLTSARISPKKGISTWRSKGPSASN